MGTRLLSLWHPSVEGVLSFVALNCSKESKSLWVIRGTSEAHFPFVYTLRFLHFWRGNEGLYLEDELRPMHFLIWRLVCLLFIEPGKGHREIASNGSVIHCLA